MAQPNYLLLYVDSPAQSAAFYSWLLDRQPVESSPTFALFVLDSGVKLGLWSKHTVEPAAAVTGGGGELGFPVENHDVVRALYKAWCDKGLPILQPPTELDFGYTFVALDPDGHRLRVFALNME
ncbi:VOC family protein [Paludibacterium purpuratum]|uniref:Catechol 2,3-dioxygenase-like lactoylglutathione lyase family enzyme n=1 Tax=Paludibacterium purpuratum TaxID=1144873 RepID=A0A4R7BCE8_9NEIS|nr:VOC family protein [Paludibacterium purpuratum]TDR82740.1 catechol 2,3-dioxygenase-like lactoylglutathione lyase family enzyme [Paludibacterium purpuratum]